jgi:hypothetical protein
MQSTKIIPFSICFFPAYRPTIYKSLLCYLKLLYKDICLEIMFLKSISVCPSFSEMPHVRRLKSFLLAHNLSFITYNFEKIDH